MSSASEKRKRLIQRMRYGVLVAFTALIIISFVVSLAYNPFEGQTRPRQRLVRVNGEWFHEGVDTGFAYWYDEQRSRLQQQGVTFDSEMESLFYTESVQNYARTLRVLSYIRQLGVRPSDFFYAQVGGALYRGEKLTPGQREFLNVIYNRDVFLGSWGDIQNTLLLSPASVGLLYQDTKNLTFDIEILFAERTNFVTRFIQQDALEAYYHQNLTNFLDTIVVDRITITHKSIVSNRVLAQNLLSNALINGWERAVAERPADSMLTQGATISRQHNPRFFRNVADLVSGGVLPRTVFENRQYHVIRINNIPSFDQLTPLAQQRLLRSYLQGNFEAIWAQQSNTLAQTISTIQAHPTGDWRALVTNMPFGHVHLPQFSLVDIYSEDKEGNIFPYILSRHPEFLQFVATAAVGDVRLFEFNGVYLYVRKNGSARQQETLSPANNQEFQYYLLTSWEADWQDAVESKTRVHFHQRR